MLRKMGAAALLALMAGFGATSAVAQEELKIGVIGPLSGGGTAWGLAISRGVQMAVDEVNAEGGVKVGGKSYKIKPIVVDDGYTASGGRTAADRLVKLEKVKFIVGPVGSPSVLGALSATEPAKVLMLSNGFAMNILKNDTHAPYNYRVISTTIEFAPAMIDWVHKKFPQVKKVGMLGTNDATGQAVLPMLSGFYKEKGIDVWTDMFDRGSQEFVPLLTRMMAQNVDLLDLNSLSPADAGLVIKQARQAGYKGLIWQVGGPGVPEIIEIAGPLAEGFMSLEMYDYFSPVGQKFAERYHAKWSGVINAQVPLWYNGAKILFEAMRRAGSIDVDKVRDAMPLTEGYDAGVVGPVVWGGMKNYGVNKQLLVPTWIAEVKDGKEVIITKITPEKH